MIEKVSKKYPGPYTVSIYYADLKKDLSVFKEKKWKVVSFGKRSDENFLKKNYLEILKNKNVVCTSMNTVFFYSAYLKKNVKLLLNNKNSNIVLTSDRNQYLVAARRQLCDAGAAYRQSSDSVTNSSWIRRNEAAGDRHKERPF